jgi:hypothetical protein
MEVYRVDRDHMSRIPETELDNEAALENHLITADGAEIGDVTLLYIGRQGTPEEGGIFDILAVDENGSTVIIELKRGKAPREIVAQALEYASGIRREDYEDLDDRYREFLRERRSDETASDEYQSLADAHADHFDLDEPLSEREFNTKQRLVLVGTEFRDVSLNMADFLREHDIDVVCVEYDSYAVEDGGLKLLVTDAVRRPLSDEPAKTSKKSDSEDYSELLLAVRERVFPQVEDELELEDPEEIVSRTRKRGIGFGPNNPVYPDRVKYGVQPRVREQGTIGIWLNIWNADKDTHREIRSALAEHIDELDGFTLANDADKSMAVVAKTLPIDEDGDYTDSEVVEEVASELVRLIEFYHPRLTEEFNESI